MCWDAYYLCGKCGGAYRSMNCFKGEKEWCKCCNHLNSPREEVCTIFYSSIHELILSKFSSLSKVRSLAWGRFVREKKLTSLFCGKKSKWRKNWWATGSFSQKCIWWNKKFCVTIADKSYPSLYNLHVVFNMMCLLFNQNYIRRWKENVWINFHPTGNGW